MDCIFSSGYDGHISTATLAISSAEVQRLKNTAKYPNGQMEA
jgi:hypothetical protein